MERKQCLAGIHLKTNIVEVIASLGDHQDEHLKDIKDSGCYAIVADMELAKEAWGKKIDSPADLIHHGRAQTTGWAITLIELTDEQQEQLRPAMSKANEMFADGKPGIVFAQVFKTHAHVTVADHETAKALQAVTGANIGTRQQL